MKKTFDKFTKGNVTVTTWQKNLKPNSMGEKRPWFHVFVKSGETAGLVCFGTHKESLEFFNGLKTQVLKAKKNNIVVSESAQQRLKDYACWKRGIDCDSEKVKAAQFFKKTDGKAAKRQAKTVAVAVPKIVIG